MKIYLAGPDVFQPNYADICDQLKSLCKDAGFTGVSPVDGDLPPSGDAFEHSRRIFKNNIALIRECDLVMANIQNFRGYEPDSGTSFEIGFAAALEKPIWCYNAPADCLVDQVPCDDSHRDKDGYQVENFGLPRNLMLAHSSKMVAGGARECLLDIWIFFQSDKSAS